MPAEIAVLQRARTAARYPVRCKLGEAAQLEANAIHIGTDMFDCDVAVQARASSLIRSALDQLFDP